MPQVIEDNDGKEVEVYTAAELTEQREAAVATAKEEAKKEADVAIKAKEEEIEKMKKVSAEKTENFKKYNELTDEQKAAYDANTTELMKRNDKTTAELEEMKTKFAEKETNERNYTKNSVLKNFHGDKEDVKKTIEEKYAILSGMPETTPDEIKARATEAAKLAGISIDSVNPLYQGFNGEAPKYQEAKDFVDSPEGKEKAQMVRDALGIKEPKQ